MPAPWRVRTGLELPFVGLVVILAREMPASIHRARVTSAGALRSGHRSRDRRLVAIVDPRGTTAFEIMLNLIEPPELRAIRCKLERHREIGITELMPMNPHGRAVAGPSPELTGVD